jgi:hypothetical protein
MRPSLAFSPFGSIRSKEMGSDHGKPMRLALDRRLASFLIVKAVVGFGALYSVYTGRVFLEPQADVQPLAFPLGY